ncbi:MAG: RNA polymerase sigma-70 factor [Chryseotalea sp. WA131a]|jgi:RNA polymerase sigma-70 factor (ECF subfamily)|nr:MAG: RNA polymerase sigma-70 factor [Chryseotalea sp. WA131a]
MQSDEENYRAIKEGNQIAFEMIFKTYYKPLCHYAHSFLNDKNEAEEVVQTTFIKIWEKKNELSVQSSLKAYLYSMVRNGCLNVIKHEKVKQLHAKWHVQETERSRDLVEEKVLSNDLESKIYLAMKALPEQCRLVFQLSRFEELKYQEIADQLQISVKTVENQMGKALKIMRTQLKEYLPLYMLFLNNFIL